MEEVPNFNGFPQYSKEFTRRALNKWSCLFGPSCVLWFVFFPGWSDDGDLTLVKDDKLTELVDQLVRRGIVGPGAIYHLRPGHYLMDRSPD